MMRQTQPSEFRHVIDILKPVKVPNGRGGEGVSYVTEHRGLRAAIWGLTAKESRESLRTGTKTIMTIRLRYQALTTTERKVTWLGREFLISGQANPNGMNRYLDLTCTEVE